VLFEGGDQPVEIVVERVVADIEAIAKGKLFKRIGQLIWFWNPGTIEQDWDDGYIALKGGPDLDTHEIVRVI
jgi:hypothetical protein